MTPTRADRFTATAKKDELYSDFLVNLNTHPVSKDITRFVNEYAVIRSIKNLMLTNRMERLYQPDLGGNIRRMLFEPMGPASADTLSSLIQETIREYEPRAKVLNVETSPDYDNNAYSVTVVFMLINKQEPISFNVTLTRVR